MENKKRLPKKRSRKPASIKVLEKASEFWRVAVVKLREQLEEDCITHAPERRHLQNRRLIENLHAELLSSNRPEYWGLMAYWLICGSPWQDQLGYEEPRRQHYAELKTLGIYPEFDRPQFQTKPPSAALPLELLFRLDSRASWIEAQESWVVWRALSDRPAAWDRDDPEARIQAMNAGMIARLPTIFDGMSDWFVAEMIGDLRRWSKPQWAKTLKMAARVVELGDQPVSELDRWVWWRYPIFMRYHWSAAEVCRAAQHKFGHIYKVGNTG